MIARAFAGLLIVAIAVAFIVAAFASACLITGILQW